MLATAVLTCGWVGEAQADGDPRPSGPGFGVAIRDEAIRRDVHLPHGHAGPGRRARQPRVELGQDPLGQVQQQPPRPGHHPPGGAGRAGRRCGARAGRRPGCRCSRRRPPRRWCERHVRSDPTTDHPAHSEHMATRAYILLRHASCRARPIRPKRHPARAGRRGGPAWPAFIWGVAEPVVGRS
jgi:hypothetical protein